MYFLSNAPTSSSPQTSTCFAFVVVGNGNYIKVATGANAIGTAGSAFDDGVMRRYTVSVSNGGSSISIFLDQNKFGSTFTANISSHCFQNGDNILLGSRHPAPTTFSNFATGNSIKSVDLYSFAMGAADVAGLPSCGGSSLKEEVNQEEGQAVVDHELQVEEQDQELDQGQDHEQEQEEHHDHPSFSDKL
jgi:hypothetical protein